MALNDVLEADVERKLAELQPAIELLCKAYGARVTLPCLVTSDEQFRRDQANARLRGLFITRYPRWYLGTDDDGDRGMDRLTFEAVDRADILQAFDKAVRERAAKVPA